MKFMLRFLLNLSITSLPAEELNNFMLRFLLNLSITPEIMQIIHSLLRGVSTPGKLGTSSRQAFMFFIFDLFMSILFLLTEFHYTFSMSYKILPYYLY